MFNAGDIVLLKTNGSYKTNTLKNLVKQKHPILIIQTFPAQSKIEIATMSSNINQVKVNLPSNVLLDNWQFSGMHKPTYVDVSSTGVIDDNNVFIIIGHLSLTEVLKQVQNTKQRQVIETYKIYNTGKPEYIDYFIDASGKINYII